MTRIPRICLVLGLSFVLLAATVPAAHARTLSKPQSSNSIIGSWIDATLDHKMLLHKDDPALSFFRQLGEPVFVMDVNPTAENIARLIYDYAIAQGFPVVEVQLWETEHCFATYSG